MDLNTVLRWGWYIFILDIPRFLLIEGVALYLSRSNRRDTRDKWANAAQELNREYPLVTVLVPGFNEGRHLYKLVESLKKQTYRNLELIIVDDGSTDDTPAIGHYFEKRGDIDLFIRSDVRGGKASAANLGLRYAKGKYIVHIDADSSLSDNAIEKILIPFYRYPNVGAVGGNLRVRNPDDSLTTTMQFMEYLQSVHVSRIVLSYLRIYKIVSGAFGAFPKTVLNRVGGWDVGPGLDGDITVKIRKINLRIVFEEEAVCHTHAPVTWQRLTRQRLRWSRSLIRFRLRKHWDIWTPNMNFSITNFLSFFENVFFGLVLDILWVYYMILILFEDPIFLLIWFPFKYTVYLIHSMTQFFFTLSVNEDKNVIFKKILYVPLYPIYIGYYMRIVRTIAYIDEIFFFDSYKDAWNPPKTSQKAREFGL